jgi:plastocyanin
MGGALLVPAVLHAADPPLKAKLESAATSVAAGTAVRLDSSHSTGRVVRHLWDLDGNGSFEMDTGASPVADATPVAAGPLTVRVRVLDDGGRHDAAALDLTVTPASDGSVGAPTAGAGDKFVSKAHTGAAVRTPTPDPAGQQQPSSSATEQAPPAEATPGVAAEQPTPSTDPQPAPAAAAPTPEALAGYPAMIAAAGPPPAATAKRRRPAVHTAASVKAAASSGVTIENFLFSPKSVSVQVGDTVTWTNRDAAPHTATAGDGSFGTGTLKKGQSGSHKFTKAGSIAYICSVHPNMKGTVVVAAGSGSGAGSGSSKTTSKTTSKSISKSSSLPLTGFDIAAVVALAALLTGSGTLLRRRVEHRA